jgi:hypothetical protein
VRLFFSFLFVFVFPCFPVDKTDSDDGIPFSLLKPAWILAFAVSNKTQAYFNDVHFQANQH